MNPSLQDRRAFLRRLGTGIGLFRLTLGDACPAQSSNNPADPTFELRAEELRRRIASLPVELDRWQKWAKEKDKSEQNLRWCLRIAERDKSLVNMRLTT